MLSAIPLLILGAGIMALFISKIAVREQTAYAKAATVVEQTLGSIRTVCHFCSAVLTGDLTSFELTARLKNHSVITIIIYVSCSMDITYYYYNSDACLGCIIHWGKTSTGQFQKLSCRCI